ncbi:MAG: 30S ribosome-binding factor RbfA [bacterium]|nr:30S ribosome-binding factor RbfA [bacterium]
MRTYRDLRVANLIQEELGKIILREMEFPVSTLVTITNVEVLRDLSQAKIKLGVIPASEALKVLEILSSYRPLLQGMLLRKINIKPMPRIEFLLDNSN